MGVITKITCKGCNQTWECHTGHGMRHGRLDAVLETYSEDVQDKIRNLIAGERFPLYDFAYQIGCCEKCKAMVSIPVLNLRKHGVFVGQCSECGEDVRISKVIEEQVCPVCEKQDWDLQEIGMWD